jgi:hypothetical protein
MAAKIAKVNAVVVFNVILIVVEFSGVYTRTFVTKPARKSHRALKLLPFQKKWSSAFKTNL